MPVRQGKDSHGSYYRWGSRKKYYYDPKSKRSRDLARQKATKQGIAVHASGWVEYRHGSKRGGSRRSRKGSRKSRKARRSRQSRK